ncbi:MAG: Snf7 family protein [Candidatus Baldrarchaeia archaeon]|mgnify:FL=1
MSFLKRLKGALTGGSKKNIDRTIAELMSVINVLQLRTKELERRAIASREKAKEFIRAGNKVLARHHLKRYVRYSKYLERYYKFAANLEDTIMEIKTAQDVVQLERALEKASNILEKTKTFVSREKAFETMGRVQGLFEEIETASEILSGDIEIPGEEEEVEKEYEKLLTEITLEAEAELPRVATAEKEVAVEDELKKEVEKLKKEEEEKEKE